MFPVLSELFLYFSSMIHEAHKQTILTGGLRIHALLQSTFEVRINDPDIR
mgnify:FL=1